ncbi:hypothetical protein CR492_14785 [Methylocella silvestris]|uniref:TIGR03067 domain-containing protein n=2 Tax=Methylocella silvestris TaxID=199596 RepID=A0A2J7TEP5_METSI|nr:hypothetical protein CR492_14785 [Methylocella silvestris]
MGGMSKKPAAGGASELEGVWKVKDSVGEEFEITLGADGTARATLDEDMSGPWTREGDAAVIVWKSGWTTRIFKEGDVYRKTAYRKGQALDTAPVNSSEAEKIG